MVEIRDRKELGAWLKGREREDAIVIAARSALRVLSRVAEIFDTDVKDPRANFVLPTIRAIESSRVSAMQDTREDSIAKASSSAADAADAATATATAAAATAAYAAATAATAAYASSAATAATAATAASYAYASSAAVWEAVSADATAIGRGVSPVDLSATPLWPGEVPDWVEEDWAKLSTALRAAPDEGWAVWIDWYEARLRGEPANFALEREIVLIPDEMWDQGPTVVNTEMRRLIEKHRPTRPQLEETVSPQPVIKDGKLDVQPNEKYDAPDGSEELVRLPSIQRSIIKTLIEALSSANNIPTFVTTALNEYSDELLVRGTRPYLDLLKYQRQIVRDEYLHLQREGFITKDGLRRSFLSYFATHKKIIEHFPLDAVREQMFRETKVDRSVWNAEEVRSLADEFTVTIKAAETAGIAKPDFVKVSLNIAEELKASTYVVPPAPMAAMDANRDLMEAHELSAADRAVIRAMTFTDSLRHLLDDSDTSPEIKKTAHDIGVGTSSSLLGSAIWKAFGG